MIESFTFDFLSLQGKSMKKKTQLSLLLLTILLIASPLQNVFAQGNNTNAVHAVLFFSPTCPHCEQVITQVLPPLQEEYGDALQILLIDVTTPEGQALYQAAVSYYEIPDERLGVPTLIANETIMVGSNEIPSLFPQIIEEGLAQGGLDWPALPGLAAFISAAGESIESPAKLTMADRFALDPQGNTISVIVLLGMLVVVGMVAINFNRRTSRNLETPIWLIPALITLGMLVAIYLSFIEMTQTKAICGPVGDCNTVQQSPYATLFGFLPVGLLGMIGYLLIFLAWMAQKLGKPEWQPTATKALWLLSGFGTLFSIYLTFLEPFVIGATCMWCITSAIVQTSIFWLSTEPAKQYLSRPASSKRRKHRKKNTAQMRKRH